MVQFPLVELELGWLFFNVVFVVFGGSFWFLFLAPIMMEATHFPISHGFVGLWFMGGTPRKTPQEIAGLMIGDYSAQ